MAPVTYQDIHHASTASSLVHQDAYLYQLMLNANNTASHTTETDRTVYIHVVSGKFAINDTQLKAGDGATIKNVGNIKFTGMESGVALVFDLP